MGASRNKKNPSRPLILNAPDIVAVCNSGGVGCRGGLVRGGGEGGGANAASGLQVRI